AVHVVEPRVSADGRVADRPGDDRRGSEAVGANALLRGPIASLATLQEVGALHDCWAAVRAEVARRLGAGLGRTTSPQALILAPARTRRLRLDEHAQRYRLALIDRRGDDLDVSLAADAARTIRRLIRPGMRRTAFLVEVLPSGREDSGAPLIEPVAALRDGREGIEVSNFELDGSRLRQWLGLLQQNDDRAPSAVAEAALPPADAIAVLSAAALDAACLSLRHIAAFDPAPLVREARDHGLTTLADALAAAGRRREPAAALTLAYVASETLACHWAAVAAAADAP
ncbi:MAG: hypothetical protein AAFT19_07135, partial [Pseudomonadota bacterium]